MGLFGFFLEETRMKKTPGNNNVEKKHGVFNTYFHIFTFKHFFFLPLFGEDEPILTHFFKWVGSTTN